MKDFDRGFGIGGASKTDPTDESMALFEAMQFTGKPAREQGWMWEPCPICGQEPVCLSCGLCENHCECPGGETA